MKQGLELSESFYNEVVLPRFQNEIPQLLDSLAVGVVGDGSECFGFDDVQSRDHEWSVDFCIWVPLSMKEEAAKAIDPIFDSLPRSYMDLPVNMASDVRHYRKGLHSIEGFFKVYTNLNQPPREWQEWYRIPEYFFAPCVNGKVFSDPLGEFTAYRDALMKFYPEEVRKKKLAARLGVMAQSGQYNLMRMLQRQDMIAASLARARFIESTIAAVFLCNKVFMPFYKWAFKSMKKLPLVMGIPEKLEELAAMPLTYDEANIERVKQAVEVVCLDVIAIMHELGLSSSNEAWLMKQAELLLLQLTIPILKDLPILHGIQNS